MKPRELRVEKWKFIGSSIIKIFDECVSTYKPVVKDKIQPIKDCNNWRLIKNISVQYIQVNGLSEITYIVDILEYKGILRLNCNPDGTYRLHLDHKNIHLPNSFGAKQWLFFLTQCSQKMEKINTEWKTIEINYLKNVKILEIAKANINEVVNEIMHESGYSYFLTKEDNRAILSIKMKRKQLMEISLPYKTFINRLDKIMPSVKIIKEALDSLDIGIRIKGYGNNVKWNNKNLI